MNNVAHVSAGFHLVFDTGLDQDTFQTKVNTETIVGTIVQFILPDGSVHKAKFAALEDMEMVEFEDNREVEKEKATE